MRTGGFGEFIESGDELLVIWQEHATGFGCALCCFGCGGIGSCELERYDLLLKSEQWLV
jgi:hypothetical protein